MNRETQEPHGSGRETERAPSKRRKWIIVLVAALLAGGLTWAWLANQEPRYGGHSLSYWLERYDLASRELQDIGYEREDPKLAEVSAQRDMAVRAVRQIKRAAIPWLLEWISQEPSSFLTRYRRTIEQLMQGRFGRWIPDFLCVEDRSRRQAGLAHFGFSALGAEAKPAIPALSRLANNPQKTETAENATSALIAIGPDALPALLAVLTNTAAAGRATAAIAIRDFGARTQAVLPGLCQLLRSEDVFVATCAAATLASCTNQQSEVLLALTKAMEHPLPAVRTEIVGALCGLRAPNEAIVPALTRALDDPSIEVRSRATNVLRRIAPKVLTNAPPR